MPSGDTRSQPGEIRLLPAPIVLAHEPSFRIGDAEFRPATREVIFAGRTSIIEPRVMQFLVALHRASGAVVSRDDLVHCCWDRRIVSEDAINRVVSRLRTVAENEAGRQFRVETITKVGYRLAADGSAVADQSQTAPGDSKPSAAVLSRTRRIVLGAGLLGSLGAIGSYALLRGGNSGHAQSPEVDALVTRARDALERSGADDQDQAIALLRRVVAIAPRYADGWALLAHANAVSSHFRERSLGLSLRAHAEAAAQRALDIEPGNGIAELALGVALPLVGAWEARERHLERALAAAPKTVEVLEYVAVCNIFSGRANAALPLYNRMPRPFQPQTFANYCQALWRTGRLEELDQALDEAASLYPTQHRVWFDRMNILLFGNRVDRALEMLHTPDGRPRSVDPPLLAAIDKIASAIREPHGALAEQVAAQHIAHEREVGAATDAVRVLAAIGRVDQALTVVEALYFGEHYVVADRYSAAFTPEQRDTRVLFEPGLKLLRANARFESVMARLGLDGFWRRNRITPDYRQEFESTEP